MVQNSAVPILIIQKIFFPVIWLFFQFTKLLDFLEKKIIKAKRPLITEEELKALIAIGENYDGDAPSLIHFDGVVKEPSIVIKYEDGTEFAVLKNGELQI